MAWTLLRAGLLLWGSMVLMFAVILITGLLQWINTALEASEMVNPIKEISEVLGGFNK